MSVLPVGFGASGSTAYQIANSLRFDGSDDYLSRTFGTPTDNTTWAFSCWVKRSKLATTSQLFGRTGGLGAIGFESTDIIRFWSNAGGVAADSTSLYRDPTAHGHFFVRSNGTNIKGYWNGVEVISYTGTINNINYSGIVHDIGRMGTYYSSGYLSDIYFIDGQALSPTDFGELNAENVWVPKAYTGSYGNNGFHLDFSDGTSTTTLGYDAAGSNDWTLSGMTRAAGVNECWMVDTPTDNFAVLNVLQNPSSATVSQGNLKAVSSASYKSVPATVAIDSGKWYWELVALSPTRSAVGVAQVTSADIASSGNYIGQNSTSWSMFVEGTNALKKYNNGTGTDFSPSLTASANDVFMVAMDADNGAIYFGKNGTWAGSADPANGTNPAYSSMTGPYFPAMSVYDGTGAAINFGQRDFAYTPPTAFLPLSTANRTYSAPTTSGSFTGNSSADGPYVWLNGNPESMTINGNAVTWGTHADKTAGGFKVRNSTSSYNASGSNTFSVTSSGKPFGDSTHAPNTAKGNQ